MIHSEYIVKIDGKIKREEKNVFIHCRECKKLQRSLFLGGGFIYSLRKVRQTSGFGTRINLFNKHKYAFHAGIDLACRAGIKVYATRSLVKKDKKFPAIWLLHIQEILVEQQGLTCILK